MTSLKLPFSLACERNKYFILAEFQRYLTQINTHAPLQLLEVGSGSGQHAIHMVRHLVGIHWQPSEINTNLEGLNQRIQLEGQQGLAKNSRIATPIALDVSTSKWPAGPFELAFSANTTHIMPASAVPLLLAGVTAVLSPAGLFFLYGPFHYNGHHIAPSNAGFDADLKARDPAMGLRDAVQLVNMAAKMGLDLIEDRPMPANNRMLVFRRAATAKQSDF